MASQGSVTRTVWTWMRPSIVRHRRAFLAVLAITLSDHLIGLAFPLMTSRLLDSVIPTFSKNTFVVVMVVWAIFKLVMALTEQFRVYVIGYITTQIDVELRQKLFRRLSGWAVSSYSRPATYDAAGEVVRPARMIGDILSQANSLDSIHTALSGPLVSAIWDIIFLPMYVLVMLYFSVTITLATVCLVAVASAIQVRWITPRMRANGYQKMVAQGRAQGQFVQFLQGAETVKTAGLAGVANEKFESSLAAFAHANVRQLAWNNANVLVSTIFVTLMGLLIFGYGGWTAMGPGMPLGQLIAMSMLADLINEPVRRLIDSYISMVTISNGSRRLADLINEPIETETGQDVRLGGAIQLSNVGFAYGNRVVLRNVNLSISAGQKVAIVGPSGGGKTTLARLVAGLLEPSAGLIHYHPHDPEMSAHGLDSRSLSRASIREAISMVTQEVQLMDGTILENIAGGSGARLPEAVRAAKLAQIHDEILTGAQGYDTRVAERGQNFSTGQRRRLTIARGLVRRCPVLLMDEPTAGLSDPMAVKMLSETLMGSEGITVIVVTHHQDILPMFDLVVRVENGTVSAVKDGVVVPLHQKEAR